MTLTTTETVTVDGVDLNTLAYNIETLSGRDALPPRRGENKGIAYRQGKRWNRKQFDQKVETWAMWVRGCDVDGVVPGTGDRAEYNKNLFMLKQLFGKIHAPLALQRKILMPSGLLVLTAEGECNGTMEPTIVGNRATLARFTADIEMADPFWYGAQMAVPVSTALSFNNPGTAITTKMVVRLGPGTNAKLTNLQTGTWLQYQGTIPAGSYVDIDTDLFTAKGNGVTNEIAKIRHGGSWSWMDLLPGVNNFTLTAGTATITTKPAYL